MLVRRSTAAQLAAPGVPGPRGGVPGPRGRRGRWTALAGAAAMVGSLLLVIPGASAEPTPTIQQVAAKVERLQLEAERASERYNETREELASHREQLAAAHTRVIEQRRRLQRVRGALGRLAAEQYREGELSTLEFVLGDSPDDYLARAGVVSTLAGRSVDIAARLLESQQRLKDDEARVAQQTKTLAAANDDLQQEKASVLAKLRAVEAQLSSLQADQRRALARAQQSADGGAGVPVGTTCSDVDITAPSARARTAIDFACAQLGDPYQWAADGPGSWDCSGLTMKAWAAASVSLPHSSAQQATHGTGVSLSALQPGDLVFRYSPISHVGLYIGNGLMIHAPSSGDVVKIAPATKLSAATRL